MKNVISRKPADEFYSMNSGKKTIEFFCRAYIFGLTTDKGSKAFLMLPIFFVNYIISIVVIYSYNHRSRRTPCKYNFENFVPIIFPCVDCSITSCECFFCLSGGILSLRMFSDCSFGMDQIMTWI